MGAVVHVCSVFFTLVFDGLLRFFGGDDAGAPCGHSVDFGAKHGAGCGYRSALVFVPVAGMAQQATNHKRRARRINVPGIFLTFAAAKP